VEFTEDERRIKEDMEKADRGTQLMEYAKDNTVIYGLRRVSWHLISMIR
jgi:hypothetical protein